MEWEDYASVLPELSERYYVFAVDCFGHGESARRVCAPLRAKVSARKDERGAENRENANGCQWRVVTGCWNLVCSRSLIWFLRVVVIALPIALIIVAFSALRYDGKSGADVVIAKREWGYSARNQSGFFRLA